MSGFWIPAVAAVAIVVAAQDAQGATFDLTAQGRNVLVGNDPGEVSTLLNAQANQASGSGQAVSRLNTAAIRMRGRESGSDADWLDYIAFCIQIDQALSLPGAGATPNSSYVLTPTHLGAERRNLLSTLFANAYDPAGDAAHQAAFQLVIWKLVHSEDAPDVMFDLTADMAANVERGYYNFDRAPDGSAIPNGFRNAHPGAWTKAESFLEGLDGDGTDDWETLDFASSNLSIFVSPTSQNLIALGEGVPVEMSVMPVPAGLPLALSGLGALALLRRRARRMGKHA